MGVDEEEESPFQLSQGRKADKCGMLAETDRSLGGLGQCEHTAL